MNLTSSLTSGPRQSGFAAGAGTAAAIASLFAEDSAAMPFNAQLAQFNLPPPAADAAAPGHLTLSGDGSESALPTAALTTAATAAEPGAASGTDAVADWIKDLLPPTAAAITPRVDAQKAAVAVASLSDPAHPAPAAATAADDGLSLAAETGVETAQPQRPMPAAAAPVPLQAAGKSVAAEAAERPQAGADGRSAALRRAAGARDAATSTSSRPPDSTRLAATSGKADAAERAADAPRPQRFKPADSPVHDRAANSAIAAIATASETPETEPAATDTATIPVAPMPPIAPDVVDAAASLLVEPAPLAAAVATAQPVATRPQSESAPAAIDAQLSRTTELPPTTTAAAEFLPQPPVVAEQPHSTARGAAHQTGQTGREAPAEAAPTAVKPSEAVEPTRRALPRQTAADEQQPLPPGQAASVLPPPWAVAIEQGVTRRGLAASAVAERSRSPAAQTSTAAEPVPTGSAAAAADQPVIRSNGHAVAARSAAAAQRLDESTATSVERTAAASPQPGRSVDFASALDQARLPGAIASQAPANPQTGAASPAPLQVRLDTPFAAPEFRAALGVEVSVLARDGVEYAELSLNPAEMGPISVRIELDGQRAQIDFGADSAATRAVIESGLPELASALREAGLTLTGGGVSEHPRPQADTSSQRQAGDQPSQQNRNGQARGEATGTAADPAREQPRPRHTVSAGGVDLYA